MTHQLTLPLTYTVTWHSECSVFVPFGNVTRTQLLWAEHIQEINAAFLQYHVSTCTKLRCEWFFCTFAHVTLCAHLQNLSPNLLLVSSPCFTQQWFFWRHSQPWCLRPISVVVSLWSGLYQEGNLPLMWVVEIFKTIAGNYFPLLTLTLANTCQTVLLFFTYRLRYLTIFHGEEIVVQVVIVILLLLLMAIYFFLVVKEVFGASVVVLVQ